jgi:hypothetical protein
MSDEQLIHTKPEPPAYNEEQLNTVVVLQRIELARKMFFFLATVVSIFGAAALYAIFSGVGVGYVAALLGTDGLFGASFYWMVRYLFPQPADAKNKGSRRTPTTNRKKASQEPDDPTAH